MQIYFWLIMCLSLSLLSCGKPKEEQIREFALDFAEKASNNQLDSLKTVYPGIENADSVALKYDAEGVIVKSSADGKEYEVLLNPDVAIIVKAMEDGSFTVSESRGLFAYEDRLIKLLKDSGEWNSTLTDVQTAGLLKELVEKRKAFTSPDLDFFGLHGPVKKMVVMYPGRNDWENLFGGWWLWRGSYKFDEDGSWVNVKEIGDLQKVKRDEENKITKFIVPPYYDDLDFDVISYSWDKNRLKRVSDRFNDGTFYYNDGLLSKFNYNVSPGEGRGYWNLTFSDFEFDDNDNWISCKWKGSYHDDYGDKDSSNGTIIRKIEYYQ